jgi:hypothetical protein
VANAIGLAIIVLLLQTSATSQQADNSAEPANELARRILLNEAKAEEQDHSHWMYRLEKKTPHGKEVDEVVETKYGDLKRRLVSNGRPLAAAQEREENERIEKLASHPQALRKSMNNENRDANRSQKMLKMLPDALTFSYGERRGDTVELHFKPNPSFRPPSNEARVFQALEGDLWVNSKQARLVELTGHIIREVKFLGGALGHLNQDGNFQVEQSEVAPGYWELTLLNVSMTGKVLFLKTINVQQQMSRSDFRRISDDVTLSQAAEMLQKEAVPAQSAEANAGR